MVRVGPDRAQRWWPVLQPSTSCTRGRIWTMTADKIINKVNRN